MLCKTITYVDYDGNERTEDFYFNLSKAEIAEMELSTEGGLEKFIKKIVDTRDSQKLIAMWKDMILKAYGEKSLDGRRFIKSEELSTAFSQTEAYSNLFIELASDSAAAAAFVNGIVPQDQDKQQVSGTGTIEFKDHMKPSNN